MSKASADINERNIQSILQYSKETRKMFRDYIKKIERLENTNADLLAKFALLQEQLQALQVQSYGNRATS